MVRKSRKQEQRDQDILERIGADRMASYLAEVHGHTGRALDLYRWNAELSGSFWSLISLTEVSLRNALDEHLGTWCQANGGHRDWLLHIDHAPDDLKAEFSGKTRTFRSRAEDAKKIRDTGAGLTVKPHRRQHASLTNGDILSQITLGEWGSFIPSPPRVLDDGTRQPFPDLTTAQRRERLWDNGSNADFAQQLGVAHELDSASPDDGFYTPAQTSGMDVYNNHTGRQVGLRLEGNRSSIKSVCLTYALNARVTDAPQNEPLGGGTDLVILRSDLN